MKGLFSEKFQSAAKALTTLEEVFEAEYSIFVRDSAIQRFEYTTEAVWKCLQLYLNEYEGIISSSPKACMREAKKVKILTDKETELALEMIDDRNLTAHTYHEEVARMLFERLPQYSILMKKILEKIKSHEKLLTGN
jgi:nucleotidyltransferase substrate binding protein (TIGR01987 family)